MRRIPFPMTAKRAFREIREYCERLGNSSWGQPEYKMDFFDIFRNAYIHSRTGHRASALYESAKKRKKDLRVEDFVVDAENIVAYLERNLKGFSEDEGKRKMARELARSWDEWTFAWDHSPKQVPRASYPRKRRKPSR